MQMSKCHLYKCTNQSLIQVISLTVDLVSQMLPAMMCNNPCWAPEINYKPGMYRPSCAL